MGLVLTAALVVAHLMPAALGLLSRWTVAAAAIAELAVASWLARRRAASAKAPDAAVSDTVASRLSPAIAAIGVSLLAGWIVAATRSRGVSAINSIDLLMFNTQAGAREDRIPRHEHGTNPAALSVGRSVCWCSDTCFW